MNFNKLDKCKEVAILFSPQFNSIAGQVYNDVQTQFPHLSVFLVDSSEILCSAKCDKYESYILLGIECPLHTFKNAVQYKIETRIEHIEGVVFTDSIYNITNINITDVEHNKEITVVTESQQVLDYYCSKYDNISSYFDTVQVRNRVEFLMKENIASTKFAEKKMVGVIFTSVLFEEIADSLVRKINSVSRAYKIYLKDVSYERLISIDNLDCVVLVDCPLFECNLKLHIPVLSPFSVNCAMTGEWTDSYNRNTQIENGNKEMIVASNATELMVKREYKGTPYTDHTQDMVIHKGRKGIASQYEEENK